jgi:predicted permease
MLALVRHSYRVWPRTPVVSVAIIVTMAIAIGANTASFSVLRAVLLDPLPYPASDRLAILWTDDPAHSVHQEGVSYPNYADWRAMNHSFADLAFFIRTTYSQANITGGEITERVQAALVSGNLLAITGIPPERGRGFTEDEIKSRSNVVIVGEALARRHFGTADVIGRSIQVEGNGATIVGVMPAAFHFPDIDTELWRPYTQLIPYQPPDRDADYLCVLGRLKPGASLEQARADMAGIGRRLEQAHPNMPASFNGFAVSVIPLYEHFYGRSTQPALWLIAAVAACVLLIAITNIANLLLACLEARDREFAVRTALGSGTSRLARQVLTEIGLLTTLGAALGLAVAYIALRLLIQAFGTRLHRLDQAALDWRVLGVALVITLAACVAAALAPLGHLRRDLYAGVLRKRASTPLKRALAISQVALATALLASAGLLIRSYSAVESIPLGYRPDHLLVFELATRGSGPPAESNAYSGRVARECRDRIRSLPGVSGVANAGDLFLRRNPDWQIYLEGGNEKPTESPLTDDIVTADFFRVMGAPLLAGRLFTLEEERDKSRPVVIINEAMAQRFWPGVNPVGRRFSASPPKPKRTWHTVIGVVGNMQLANREAEPVPEMFWAIADNPDLKFVVRTASDPNGLLAAIRREVHTLDPAAVVYRPIPVEAQIDRWMSQRRMNTSVVGIFSVLATLLAVVGIFSLLHYATALRTREFGVRFALGATRSNLLALVAWDGVMLASIGALAGGAAAIAAGRAFSSLLFGVQPWDAETLVIVGLGAIGLAAVASLAPAIRAAMVNPAEALRAE